MNTEASAFWSRAIQAFHTATHLTSLDADAAASRAFYAAFYAVSALFARQGRTFSRHSALEVAVHRDLVREGLWPTELGREYSFLLRLRATSDYGGGTHVSNDEAVEAVEAAHRILQAVRNTSPEAFSEIDGTQF